MSIKMKINLFLLTIGVLTSFCVGAYNYHEAKKKVVEDAFNKASLISSFAMASRNYTVKTMRPLALEISGHNGFHPELMGGFFVARSIADQFSKKQPGYSFKQATLDPVNAQNRADSQERQIISDLSQNRSIKMKKGMIEKNGHPYYYIAQPVVAKKECLRCHGRRETALPGRVQRYPGTGGYHYKPNKVVAAFITYVPLNKALENLNATSLKMVGASILSIVLIVAAVWAILEFFVTKPIGRLTTMAEHLSRGKGLDQQIVPKSNDEIGALYNAFNRMRVSVIKLIKIINQKK